MCESYPELAPPLVALRAAEGSHDTPEATKVIEGETAITRKVGERLTVGRRHIMVFAKDVIMHSLLVAESDGVEILHVRLQRLLA